MTGAKKTEAGKKTGAKAADSRTRAAAAERNGDIREKEKGTFYFSHCR